MIFVDTGAWFASVIPTDSNHKTATEWLKHNSHPLLTTDYVVDETLTLLRMRREYQKAIAIGNAFFSGRLATIHYLTQADIQQTWLTFKDFADKNWSFTDCSSKVVMAKLQISQAFAFDHHFQQFGSVQVMP